MSEARRRRVALLALLVAGAGCAAPRDAAAPAATAAPPNIVWIVVDTLRADHLPFHGYGRDTAPDIGKRLVERGARFERAYAPAPWTMPSVLAYMTGLDPRRLVGEDGGVSTLAERVETVAERLHAHGYATAGFSANLLLSEENGAAQGFNTWWSVKGGFHSLSLHADTVQRRVVDWLAARAPDRRPLLLYVHYIDPHDPYDNPDIAAGRAPFASEAREAPSGGRITPVYDGSIVPADPAAVRRHFAALYDDEIAFVDRFVGTLVGELERRLGANTLFVFCSDHGEELGERGGWKHGQTLYEEQIRVPLVFRWDGRIAPGRRLSTAVSLLDVAPTLYAAAGVEPPAGLDGVDLLPALLDVGRRPPARAQVARSWQFGALRLAAVAGRRKVLLFNHREPFEPDSPLQRHLEAKDRARMRRFEAYDLDADPEERHPAPAPETAADRELVETVYAALDDTLSGLRLLVRGLPRGATLTVTARPDGPAAGILPLFLDDADAWRADAGAVTLRLGADALPKGVLLRGVRALGALEWSLEGAPRAKLSVRLGGGESYPGGAVPAERLFAARFPAAGAGPELVLWYRSADVSAPAASEETERALRALGYLQ